MERSLRVSRSASMLANGPLEAEFESLVEVLEDF